MKIWILVSKNASPAQPLVNIMDVNARKVFIGYINQYLSDISSEKWILHVKNNFFVWWFFYFGTIFGYFFGHFMIKLCIYGEKCSDKKYYSLKNLYLIIVVMYKVI